MVQVDCLTSRLRSHNVVPGQTHVDALPGAALAGQGGEHDRLEEGRARPGLTVVGRRVTDRQSLRTAGNLRGRGVVAAAWQTLAGLAVTTVNHLTCGVGTTHPGYPNIALLVPLTVRL